MEISRKILMLYIHKYQIQEDELLNIFMKDIDELYDIFINKTIVLDVEQSRRLINIFGVQSVLNMLIKKGKEVKQFETEYRAANIANAH